MSTARRTSRRGRTRRGRSSLLDLYAAAWLARRFMRVARAGRRYPARR